jgi:(p)ppGpp synthase/HD superfamily hydrolase
MDALVVKRALDRAAVWHEKQLRKYPGVEVPYVSHVAGVAAILSRHGFDDEVVAAGALHDTMEDCDVGFGELEQLFGRRVAELVQHCSEQDKSLSWEERKQRYLEHFVDKPWEAQAITLADKIDNFQSILVCARDFGDPWKMFKRGRDAQLQRFTALAERLTDLPRHALIDEYHRTLAELRRV